MKVSEEEECLIFFLLLTYFSPPPPGKMTPIPITKPDRVENHMLQ